MQVDDETKPCVKFINNTSNVSLPGIEKRRRLSGCMLKHLVRQFFQGYFTLVTHVVQMPDGYM